MELLELRDIGIAKLHENAAVFIVMMGCVQMELIYICLAVYNHLINETMDVIQEIVDRRSQSSSRVYGIYQTVEETNTKLGEAFGKCAILFTIMCLFSPILSPISYAIFHVPTPNQWQLPMPFNMHFRTDTNFGFYMGIFLQSFLVYAYAYWVFGFLLLYISLYLCVDTFKTDLSGIVADLNSSLLEQHGGKLRKEQTSKIALYLRDFVDLHNDMLKVINRIRILMSGPLFLEFTSCIIETVMELLSFDYVIQQRHVESIIFTNIAASSTHMSMVYILCFYAEKYTIQAYQMTHLIFCDLIWFDLPIHHQKTIVLPICRAQKQFRLTGFGIFDVTMETYLKIIRSSISYFIIMRQLKP